MPIYIDNIPPVGCIIFLEIKKEDTIKKQVPGSISFVASVAGLIIAGEVIKDILEQK